MILKCYELDIIEHINLPKIISQSSLTCNFYRALKSVQGQSKYVIAVGIQEAKGACDALTRQGQEKDLHLNSEKQIGILERQKRKEIYFKPGQNRNKIQSSLVFRESGLRGKHRLGEEWKQNKKGRLMPDDRGGKSVSSSLGS